METNERKSGSFGNAAEDQADATVETVSDAGVNRRGLLRTVVAGSAASLLNMCKLPASAAGLLAGRKRGKLREYWIQADSFFHNLVPNGVDGVMGTTFTPDQTSYWAVGFRAYTPHWGQPLPGSDLIGANTGIPGPILRAQVGDTIRVHFRNNDTHYGFPHSIHPHGVRYGPDSDGAWMAVEPNKPGTAIAVGHSYTYEYVALPSSVGTWVYHDHSVPQSLTSDPPETELGAQLGLFGIFAITDYDTPPVDREIVLFFHDLYGDDVPSLAQDFDCFNGYAYVDNTPTFKARLGERIRWRVAALGKEFHVFHLHGHRWLYNGRHDDALVFGPAATLTFEYTEDNPGSWLYHCHVTDHMMGGMVGRYISR